MSPNMKGLVQTLRTCWWWVTAMEGRARIVSWMQPSWCIKSKQFAWHEADQGLETSQPTTPIFASLRPLSLVISQSSRM